MSAQTQKKQEITPVRPRMFWLILESRIWTNRTEKKLQDRLIQLKDWVFNLEAKFKALQAENNLSVIKSEMVNLENENNQILQDVIPDLYKYYAKATDNAAVLDSDILQLIQYNEELESLPLAKIELRIKRKVTRIKDKINKLLGRIEVTQERREIVPGELNYNEVESIGLDPKFSRFENVDNEASPLKLYPNWATVYHYQGKRYGTKKPAVSDCTQKIFHADALFPFSGKTVLELGSFEGGNTKQIADCGASSIIGIEANPEFYTKSLIIKNFFGLDTADFIFGNCTDVITNHEKVKGKKFDICFVSGILYHMEDPLGLIELISGVSDVVYVWTQVADETFPKSEWQEIKDAQGRTYNSKRNVYTNAQKWGGVSTGARWLAEESMKQAFTSRGYELQQYETERTGTGLAISFLAMRK